jgi:small GTP-binding protein
MDGSSFRRLTNDDNQTLETEWPFANCPVHNFEWFTIRFMIHTGRTKWTLVTLGDYAVGKTSLIRVIADATFNPKEVTTIGMDPFQTTLSHEGEPVDVVIWDTAGQERFKSLIPVYSRRSDAALLVFDMTSLDSFKGLDEKFRSFIKICENRRVVFVVASKMDLCHEFVVKEEDAIQWAKDRDLPLFFTSAKTGLGIEQLKAALAKRFAESRPEATIQVPIELQRIPSSKPCC